jgi:PIN domain nuclease of toxin-antitoxin system
VTTVFLDAHVVHWRSAEPEGISRAATKALSEAHELAVAAIT